MRYFGSVAAIASCFILPALATTVVPGSCAIVANVTVAAGDLLGKIANDNGVTLDQILFVNPKITDPNVIYVGEVIAIPEPGCKIKAAAPPPPGTVPCKGVTKYTVVPGDTLYIIATEKVGVTLAALIAANPQITNPNVISPGQVIKVPPCPAPAPLPPPPPVITATCSNGTVDNYTVVDGDNLFNIATIKFNITLAALLSVNPQITNPNLIFKGQVINIPLCKPPVTGAASTKKVKHANKKQTPKIANKKQTPKTANKKRPPKAKRNMVAKAVQF